MLLAQKRKKILVVCPHPVGYVPGQRLKFEQYFDLWRNAGFELDISPFMSESMQQIVYKKGYFFTKITGTMLGYLQRVALMFRMKKYQVVYIFLWVTPFGPPIFEWLSSKLAKKIVYDIDDLVYKGATSPNNSIIKFLKSGSKVNFLMGKAAHVIVSTDKLLSYAQQFSNSISVIPATIDVKMYHFDIKKVNQKIIIGWSGSHTTSKYLLLLTQVLKIITASHNVIIKVMGDPTFTLDGIDIELVQWTAETEADEICSFDIGLHPLPDEEWVYGKSGGKLVQYMAAGVPVIASAIGPNFKAIDEGYNGFLVTTDEEWIQKLTLLITDTELRKRMSENSRKRAVEKYSVEANLGKYLAVFNNL